MHFKILTATRNKMENTRIKYFTPSEAKKTLPLVKQIVKDILDSGYHLKTIARSTGVGIEGNKEVERLSQEIDGYMKEIQEIGCYYKDWNFSIGLVDFPAIINDEEVFLCWRSDEDDIYFYHGINDGYAARKKIPKELILD